jgi:hypothetical protein
MQQSGPQFGEALPYSYMQWPAVSTARGLIRVPLQEYRSLPSVMSSSPRLRHGASGASVSCTLLSGPTSMRSRLRACWRSGCGLACSFGGGLAAEPGRGVVQPGSAVTYIRPSLVTRCAGWQPAAAELVGLLHASRYS